MKTNLLFSLSLSLSALLASCSQVSPLEYALEQAGDNRPELERVLAHYKSDPEKLAAAEFLIENMPAHFSYKDSAAIHMYYEAAIPVLESDLSPVQQRDTLYYITTEVMPGIDRNFVSDIKVITADYLIYSIDHAFNEWKTRPWASHLTFDEFCEWLLPYKTVEKQEFDYWRDTLSNFFSDNLKSQLPDDDEMNTTYRTVDIVRNEILSKVTRYGWYTEAGYPLLSAPTMRRITHGRCIDYVTLGVNTYRSLGIPTVIDQAPYYGRFRAGHSWDVILTDRGELLPSEWDLATEHGKKFFPDQRFPKVYRNTYAINRDRVRYRNESALKYPFDFCVKDVTEMYTRTSDIEIDINTNEKLAEKYCYIAIFNGHNVEWSLVDYGEINNGKACFKNIGRNVLYLAMGFNGKSLVPLNDPFILHRDGSIEYYVFNGNEKRPLDIHRKYFEGRNVAEMRLRLKGGKIQAANRADFSDAVTMVTIENQYVPDKFDIQDNNGYRYWRYLGADGSHGSIAELVFFDQDTVATGSPIGCKDASKESISKAFDGNYLTNFETDDPDGAWVGMDFGTKKQIRNVRVIPRSDDNDIHVGDVYELLYYNGTQWVSLGKKTATSNVLHYDDVPAHALYWVKDHTQGWDERPFIIRENNQIEWR